MAIDAGTQDLMTNWAVWRLCREQPGLAVTNAYSLVGGGGRSPNGTIVLLNDEAFDVEQAVSSMADYLRQAIVEYWLRSEPVDKKASRCKCSVRAYWYRLERGHQAVHTFRRAKQERDQKIRDAHKNGALSLGF